MKKKVDDRVKTLIENAVKTHTRAFFVIVGDNGRDQVVNLHYMLAKAEVKARPSVLWCYNKDLGFSSHRKKRMKQIKKMSDRGLLTSSKDDPFELFVSSTSIRYCYYKETQKILGNTFGVLVLQDFEAITPNVLARTIETVEGGGMVILLLRTMTSLKQLYAMSMSVHSRYRTEAHQDTVARFNERFLLSLSSCPYCLVMDDELNLLPISTTSQKIEPIVLEEHADVDGHAIEHLLTENEKELIQIKKDLEGSEIAGPLVTIAKTRDQARIVMSCIDVLATHSMKHVIAITAARGRGKSAAMGLAVAAAVAHGYNNICVSSPAPENLVAFFDFVLRGLQALDMKEHMDYTVSHVDTESGKVVTKITLLQKHRQVIQYISPTDSAMAKSAELMVIDEAAAIPLPLVKELLGNYLVFISSTINGYEGTGRSLSLKLLSDLRQKAIKVTAQPITRPPPPNPKKERKRASAPGSEEAPAEPKAEPVMMANPESSDRMLLELTMEEPIRYAPGDEVENWLFRVLCLDVTNTSPEVSGLRTTPPQECSLYWVDRDTLFSYHPVAEAFLKKLMALFVSSHYKNTPNDLMLMSDAPAHHVFVLLGPVQKTAGESSAPKVPEILCAIQVAYEGEISKASVLAELARGEKKQGDLIPWTIAQQYQDPDFASLSGARVVRIATSLEYARMGYGTRSLELLKDWFNGNIIVENANVPVGPSRSLDTDVDIHKEEITVRKNLSPLLVPITRRQPEPLHWLGVAYGLTKQLFGFWSKSSYLPVYLRQTANDLTGEFSCVQIHALNRGTQDVSQKDWLQSFHRDFQKRMCFLSGYAFSSIEPDLLIQMVNPSTEHKELTKDFLRCYLSPFDMKRLDSYANNMVDFHVIMDLVPNIALLYYQGYLGIALNQTQNCILASIGLQHKTIDVTANELHMRANPCMALFSRIMVNKIFYEVETGSISKELDAKVQEDLAVNTKVPVGDDDLDLERHEELLDEPDNKEEKDVEGNAELELLQQKMLTGNEEEMASYAIKWDKSELNKITPGTKLVSIARTVEPTEEKDEGKKPEKKHHQKKHKKE